MLNLMEINKSLLLCFSFLTMLQQSAEAQDAVKHPQMRFDVSSPFVGGVFTPIPNMCEQV